LRARAHEPNEAAHVGLSGFFRATEHLDCFWNPVEAFIDWFMGLGERYNVNPIVFGSIYVGAIPFFTASIAWLVRNLRRRRSIVAPVLSASFFFVSAYLYLIVVGRDIPLWVYFFVAAMVAFGIFSTLRKIRGQLRNGEEKSSS